MQVESKITGQKETATIVELFFHLIRCGMGKAKELPRTPGVQEWDELFSIAKKQTLAGIAFAGIEKLPQEQRPPKTVLLQWYNLATLIKKINADLNRKCAIVSGKFKSESFANCILKGQGLAQLYPDPTLRTPGDIDIWLMGEREEILGYVRRHVPNCKPVYHHVDFPVVKDVDIEVHFTPTWMNSPVTNRRLQKFFREQSSFSFSSSSKALPTPDLAFNRVYILVHIYRHLFAEGIGLRQLLDYYFVLCQGFTEEEREETMRALRALKMQRFATAVMWVLQQVFGMDSRYLLTAPNEQEGRFLLSEIMLAGNFGQYDERVQHVKGESRLHWGLRKVVRNFRFVRSYPSEVLWSPLFKLWQFFFFKG